MTIRAINHFVAEQVAPWLPGTKPPHLKPRPLLAPPVLWKEHVSMTPPQKTQPPNQARRWPWRRGRPRELADALAAFGMSAEITGRSVRAWLPEHADITVLIEPHWHRPGGYRRLRWRMWLWRRGDSSGWRLRKDTTGVAVSVATLLKRGGRY